MQVSTSLFFNQATTQMGNMQTALSKTQEQLSTGLQLTQPSDSPSQAVAIQNLNTKIDDQNTYTQNLTDAGTTLSTASTALQTGSNVLNSINTLAIQAANGTLGSSDLHVIGAQIQDLTSQLESLANTQDANGNYVFAGSKASSPAFATNADGQIVYQGDQTPLNVQIGSNLTVQSNVSGTAAFPSVTSTNATTGQTTTVGFFQALTNLTTAVNSGNTADIEQGIGQIKSMTQGLNETLAQLGNAQNMVKTQTNVVSANTLALQSSLSTVQATDYTTAVTQLSQEQLSLQAAQESFAQISKMSLFQYLGG